MGRLRESATKWPEPPSPASRTESSGLCVVRVSAGRLGDADADAQRLRPALRQKPRDSQLFDGARDSRQRRVRPPKRRSRVGSARGTR
ncbi:hypothetical protein AURDEDRAFT_161004 [Auricularia subglabra TFB-10046 SS5]|nr:hypothetical protein AURDEDRAFT_161004 [Auricularia subglabra TFB-10046 SS5]